MRIARIQDESYVDGPGARVVVFAQGCSIHCPGCQNKCLWDPDGGYEVNALALAETLNESGKPITISGGEPFDQPHSLYRVLRLLRMFDPHRHVIVYTGYTFDELVRTGRYEVLAALSVIDVLVDGPYVRELDATEMQYRGSSNQRAINMRSTLAQPVGLTFSRGPIELDWDTPELVLTDDGDLLAATPVAREYAGAGELEGTRRCGEVHSND